MMLKPYVSDQSRMCHIIRRVDDFRIMWDACRRPSHPAGPGRGRKTSSNVIAERKRAFEQVRPLHEARANFAFHGGSADMASQNGVGLDSSLLSFHHRPHQQHTGDCKGGGQ